MLFLANIILLAHAVIPLHHHVLVFIPHYFCSEHSDVNHTCQHHENEIITFGNEHHADEDVSLENCLLDKDYIHISNNNRLLQSSESDANAELLTDFQNFISFLSSGINMMSEPDSGLLSFRQKPYLISTHSIQFTRSNGFRAPPFC